MQSWLRHKYATLALLGLACLFFGIGAVVLMSHKPLDEQQRVALIQQELRLRLQEAERGISQCVLTLKQEGGYLNFGALLDQQLAYPTFIFRENELVFWSDHRLEFTPEDLNTRFREQLLKNKSGLFVVRAQPLYLGQVSYDLYALVPLQRNYRIENRYLSNTPNPKIFRDEDVEIFSDRLTGAHSIKGRDGNILFSLNFGSAPKSTGSAGSLWFLAGSLILAILLVRLLNEWLTAQRYWLAAWLTVAFILMLRSLMYWFTPADGDPLAALFAPQYFAWSEWTPSLGDLLLNVTLVLLVVAVWSRAQLPAQAQHWRIQVRVGLGLLFWLASFAGLLWQYKILEAIYLHSSISLDITLSLSWEWPRLVTWLVFLIFSTAYFLLNILCWRQLNLLFSVQERREILPFVLFGGVLFVLILLNFISLRWQFEPLSWFVLLHTLLAYVFLHYEHLIWEGGFSAFLTLAASLFIQAWLGAYVVSKFEPQRQQLHKMRFAEQILQENDGFGEVLLYDAAQKIERDPLIQRYLRFRTLTPRQVVTKKIRRFYLGSYFDKYQTEIFIYDKRGTAHSPAPAYDSLRQEFARPELATAYPGLFFVADLARNSKQYFAFLESRQGRIVLQLTLKKYVPNSVYPNLLLDNAYMTPPIRDLSYAVLQDSSMLFHWGSFSYDRAFLQQLEQEKNEAEVFYFAGHEHQHFLRPDRHLILSTPNYGWQAIVSNFSFLFLLQVFFAFPTLLLYRFLGQDVVFSFQFSTRIQLYLNLAFFLPLLLVGALIIGLLNRESRYEIEQTYREKSELAARNLADQLRTYMKQRDTLSQSRAAITPLAEKLSEVSKLTGTEIHLFNTEGLLLLSNQPALYDSHLLSERVNPKALQYLIEQQQNFLITDEQIGKLNYNAVYVDIESFEEGRQLGILGVPFFESGERTEQQIIDILTIILNVFTLIFILLLVISYALSRRLTRPLELIREKMQQVSLREKNLPLSYRADDEIGALVKEYNKMIYKLEESKQALARSEKESAWREMAKQVAHEIKNPLTPMKLTLQHLQRALGKNGGTSDAPIRTLLTQIDTLSDIANSFSVFAKMPIPKEEVFDLSRVVQQTVALYENHDRAVVDSQLTPGKFMVEADAALIGRILTNLILNGIQSVPPEEIAKITVELYPTDGERLCVSVRDNGCGIPQEHQHKIFIPSFTTKSSGSGIGLAVAKKGIEHAGGKIWFESEAGLGSTFFIELPLVHKTAPQST